MENFFEAPPKGLSIDSKFVEIFANDAKEKFN